MKNANYLFGNSIGSENLIELFAKRVNKFPEDEAKNLLPLKIMRGYTYRKKVCGSVLGHIKEIVRFLFRCLQTRLKI